MDIKDKRIVVTGGASGIGAGLARRAKDEGAGEVIILDMDTKNGNSIATEIDGAFYALDVSDEAAVKVTIETIEKDHGPIDLFFSNAGILKVDEPDFNAYDLDNAGWEASWQVNVMAHIYIARTLFPKYKERGGGGFVITASAAGLLSQMGAASYSTTKHAAVGLAESLAISHGDDGIYVAALCPQAVESKMIADAENSSATLDGILSAEEMAERAFNGIKADKFMIRPHGTVVSYFQQKAANYDRWLGGMRKLRRMQLAKTGIPC